MPDDPATPDQIREAHPDWTDEQVTAEVTRLAKPAEPPAEKPAEKPEDLGDAGKAALDAERKARRDAEKRAAALEKEKKEREDAELTENERLKQENEENRAKADAATAKAQNANLLAALADKGLVGSKAKAAIRLLDEVEFDDDDEPTNLDDAITAASATYGESQFAADAAPRPPAPRNNAGAGNQPGPEPSLRADELAMAAKIGMPAAAYEEMKEVRTLEDYEAARRRLETANQQ